VIGLAVLVAGRADRSGLHRIVGLLLGLIAVWIVSMVLVTRVPDGPIHAVGVQLAFPPALFMSPMFLLAMTRYWRVGLFEDNRSADAAVLVPFALLYVAFVTNDHHGLVFAASDADIMSTRPAEWAGPLFWGFQVWTNVVAVAGLALCVRPAWVGPTRADRRRAVLLIAAALAPLIAHAAYVFAWLSLDYPLTPLALCATSLLLVAGIWRLNLLEVRPVVARKDVIEALPDGVVLTDAEQRVVDVNPAAAELLNLAPAAARGQSLAELLAPIGADPATPPLSSLLDARESGRARVLAPGRRGFEVSAGRTGEGEHAGHYVLVRDCTYESQREERLRQTQKLESVGVLAAGVAHEVNNPLAFLRSNLTWLAQQRRLPEPEPGASSQAIPEGDGLADFRSVVSECLGGIDRIGRIVESLLRFSRNAKEEFQPEDINEVLGDAIALANLESGHRLVLGTELAPGLPLVSGSSDRLVQVFLNILLNARHAVEGKLDAEIAVVSSRGAETVEVSIRDNGNGIDPEVLERIFDPFFTTRSTGEGSGLGLSIAYDIVREHDGSLEVESSPGSGATFRVVLPVMTSDDETKPAVKRS
jgi:signal transduction histidine kinase